VPPLAPVLPVVAPAPVAVVPLAPVLAVVPPLAPVAVVPPLPREAVSSSEPVEELPPHALSSTTIKPKATQLARCLSLSMAFSIARLALRTRHRAYGVLLLALRG
jgi:hypothetical protein